MVELVGIFFKVAISILSKGKVNKVIYIQKRKPRNIENNDKTKIKGVRKAKSPDAQKNFIYGPKIYMLLATCWTWQGGGSDGHFAGLR